MEIQIVKNKESIFSDLFDWSSFIILITLLGCEYGQSSFGL